VIIGGCGSETTLKQVYVMSRPNETKGDRLHRKAVELAGESRELHSKALEAIGIFRRMVRGEGSGSDLELVRNFAIKMAMESGKEPELEADALGTSTGEHKKTEELRAKASMRSAEHRMAKEFIEGEGAKAGTLGEKELELIECGNAKALIETMAFYRNSKMEGCREAAYYMASVVRRAAEKERKAQAAQDACRRYAKGLERKHGLRRGGGFQSAFMLRMKGAKLAAAGAQRQARAAGA
jgi:hypothetical protein